MTEALDRTNETSGKPFYVGISVGIHAFRLKTYEDFLSASAQADKKLYEAKKTRRADVRKPLADSSFPLLR